MALPDDDPRLSDYTAMARRQWPLVLGTTVAVALLASLVTLLLPQPEKARVLVILQSETRPIPEENPSPADPALELAVAQSEEVKRRAHARIGAPHEAEIAQVADRPLLTITASSSQADEAARTANAYAAAFIEVRNEQVAAALQAGLESVEDRLLSLEPKAGTSTTMVDPDELAQLRLAAELLGDAATSGDLAAVETAVAQVQAAASQPLVGDDALLLVRRTQLEQLADQLVVAISALQAAGPRIAVEAEPQDVTGGLSRVLPAALVAGLLLGLAAALARELHQATVQGASELPTLTGGAPVLAELGSGHSGHEALRAAVLLALPDGGVLQIAGVSSGAEAAVLDGLRTALELAHRDVIVADLRGTSAPEGQDEGWVRLPVPVAHRSFAALLAQHADGSRLVLALSPLAQEAGDAALVAQASDASLLAVVPGQDRRPAVRRASTVLRRSRLGLLGTVTVRPEVLRRPTTAPAGAGPEGSARPSDPAAKR